MLWMWNSLSRGSPASGDSWKMDTGASMFCHNNWCAIKIAHQSDRVPVLLTTSLSFRLEHCRDIFPGGWVGEGGWGGWGVRVVVLGVGWGLGGGGWWCWVFIMWRWWEGSVVKPPFFKALRKNIDFRPPFFKVPAKNIDFRRPLFLDFKEKRQF